MIKRMLLVFVFLSLILLSGCENEDYMISFETNGGNQIDDVSASDIDLNDLPVPVREGYTFMGWFLNEELDENLGKNLVFTASITLYAKWDPIILNTYTINFETNGGTSVVSISQVQGTAVSAPLSPSKAGHTFSGWYEDLNLTLPVTFVIMPDQNKTYYAKWDVNSYTITFITNGGSILNPMELEYGSTISIDYEPELDGYIFNGWYTNLGLTDLFSTSLMPDMNITLYAKWRSVGTIVTFDSQGGSDIDSIQGLPGDLLTEPSIPTREGYVFSGWFESILDTELYLFDTIPLESITLYADWGTEGLSFTLIHDDLEYEVGAGEATELSTIVIPKYHQNKKVTRIMDYGFYNIDLMNIIILQNTILEIGNGSFMGATSLSQMNLPDHLEFIGAAAFRLCNSLGEVNISDDNLYFISIDGILFSKDLETLIRYPQAKAGTSYILPNTVITIGEDAFSSADYLTSIDLGSVVTTIKTHAFFRMANLGSIVIPNQVTTLELYAFRECSALVSVMLGSGLSSIESYVFDGCVSLQSIIIPFNISAIRYGAFYNCNNLSQVYILRTSLDGMITAGLFMFTNTSSTMKINFPNQMTVDAYKTATIWVSYASKMQVGTP